MHPLDLVDAAPWRRVIFTTYALSLSFVEAVILDRLVRGGGQGAMILSDPEGVRAGLSEQGARRAGRDYELEPVFCSTGVFHPKLSMFFDDTDAHMLVGSGNLTFGGWGMNLETVEHLHPSFAAEAFDDAAEFFELMSISENMKCGVADRFEEIANELRSSAKTAPRSGCFRLLHSVGGAIGQQLTELADDLGGAQRLTVVSPYFDVNGGAIARLAEMLGCDNVSLHVHPSSPVRGLMGTNWPSGTAAKPVCIADPFGNDSRPLHAKCFEVICRRGRLLMTGSANATRAALEVGNIEASLVRIQRDTLVGWAASSCDPPLQFLQNDDKSDDEKHGRIGILRAVLEGDRIHGLVIEPVLTGEARLKVVLSAGHVDLGNVTLEASGKFETAAPDLEMQSWSGGRMVLRIEQGERAAEGFVSVASAAEIIRRAGAMAPRLLAMLSGTDTPEDVAAILTWFKEDPKRILQSASSGTSEERTVKDPIWVPIEMLTAVNAPHSVLTNGGYGDPAWQRALWLVKSAFTEKRGPWKSGTDQDDQAEDEGGRESEAARQKQLLKEEQAKSRAIFVFSELLDEMLDERHQGRHVSAAFVLAHYLVDRIRPAPLIARGWLGRIINSISGLGPSSDAVIAAAMMLVKATDGQDRAPERARRFLLRNNIDPDTLEVDFDSVAVFVEVFTQEWNGSEFLAQVRKAKTAGEEVRAYLNAVDQNGPRTGYEKFQQSLHWPKLSKALDDPSVRARIYVVETAPKACPKCNIVMPTASQQELRIAGVTEHCRLILCREL